MRKNIRKSRFFFENNDFYPDTDLPAITCYSCLCDNGTWEKNFFVLNYSRLFNFELQLPLRQTEYQTDHGKSDNAGLEFMYQAIPVGFYPGYHF